FHVDPLSDVDNEPYYALFQLTEGDTNRLAVGNAMEAWGFSAAYTSETGPSNKAPGAYLPQNGTGVMPQPGEYNLQSAHPEGNGQGRFQPYELPNHNHERTMVFKVQYVPSGD